MENFRTKIFRYKISLSAEYQLQNKIENNKEDISLIQEISCLAPFLTTSNVSSLLFVPPLALLCPPPSPLPPN